MIKWEKVSNEDSKLIGDVIKRAEKLKFLGATKDRVSLDMDITAAHTTNPLKLQDWLLADDFNFMHDVVGISNNINRDTGEMDNCFLPRFTK